MGAATDHLKNCWMILPAVSRSFALCIRKLPKGLDERMMCAYLVFRVIDTIEDSTCPLQSKLVAFDGFLSLLADRPADPGPVFSFREMLMRELDFTYEKELLENVGSLLEVFHGLGQKEREAILTYAREMVTGMVEFQERTVSDFRDQEEYCYYVAGIVGYLNTHLFHLSGEISAGLRDRLLELSKNFGIALQKVNVLRDVAYDIPKGRHFWPEEILRAEGLSYGTLCLPENRDRAMRVLRRMVENAIPYLEDAMEYITLLPRTSARIRVFCLIPLFMALESYEKCVGNEDIFNSGKNVKISKDDVRRIVRNSFLLALSNTALRAWFNRRMDGVWKKLDAEELRVASL